MICPRCKAAELGRDLNGRVECSACFWHPRFNDEVDLVTVDVQPPETADELEARHRDRLQAWREGMR